MQDFLGFGHKFSDRHVFVWREESLKEQSYIFTQFLDCVWQIMRRYPSCFEFTER